MYLLSDPKTEIPVEVAPNGDRVAKTAHYAPNVMASVVVVEIAGDVVSIDPGKH